MNTLMRQPAATGGNGNGTAWRTWVGRIGRAALPAAALCLAVAGVAASREASASPRLHTVLVVSGYADGETLDRPRGVAFDPLSGAIYVANTGAHRIDVFSRSGRPLARFVHRVIRADGTAIDGEPSALAFDQAGRLLVVDNAAAYVDVLTRRGRQVGRLAIPAGHPSAVAVTSGGTIVVGTSAEASKIYRFGRDYKPAGSWGEPGGAPGQLQSVTALAPLADGNLAVACARTDLGIQIFTPAGQYLRGYGTHDFGDGNVSLPSGMIATADGNVWVIDEIRQILQVFDAHDSLVAVSGGRGSRPGEFARPSSITTDGKGFIAVTDRELGRVQVFRVSER